MLIWFLMIGVAGLRQILLAPLVLKALNPFYAIKFALENNGLLLIIMSAVIIVITGVEALYADLGHFNKKIIRQAWLYIALPSLVFNYFGQGALLLNNNLAIDNPFYLLIPEKFRLISIIISLIATIIASQAVISGLFSSISQAIMLDFLPKIKIVHTSSRYQGQIYIPQVNFYLMVMTIFAVLFFQKSENLANAYGLSVAGVMLISSILLIIVAKFIWQWSNKKIFIYLIPLLFLDGLFIIANLTKVIHGGWYTLLLASILFCLFYCWIFGKKLLKKSSLENNLEETLLNYSSKYPRNIPGCAVFTCYNNIPPRSLSIQLEHFKSLQQKNIILSIKIENQPRVAHKKFVVKTINDNIYILNAKFGFYEQIDYNQITTWLIKHEFLSNSEDISYIFSRIVPITNKNVFNIKSLINYIYIMMVKNSVSPHEFYKINYTKVIELGTRYQIE